MKKNPLAAQKSIKSKIYIKLSHFNTNFKISFTGSALMKIIDVYREIQEHEINIVS